LPGASYLFVVPAAIAGVTGILGAILARRAPHREGVVRLVAVALPTLTLVTLWSPWFFFLYDAFGAPGAPLFALGAAAATTTTLPLVAGLDPGPRAIVPGAIILAALGAATAAASTPPFTPESPSRVNVLHVEDATSARVIVDNRWGRTAFGPIPSAMRLALGAARTGPRFPWAPDEVLETDAQPAGLPPPEARGRFVVGEHGRRRIVAHVRSQRGARAVTLLLPPGSDASFVRIAGREPAPAEVAGWRMVNVVGVPDAGFEVEIATTASGVDLTVLDETPNLPPTAARVAAARPPNATQTQRGDASIVSRRLRLE
jgi:hypothetical protein